MITNNAKYCYLSIVESDGCHDRIVSIISTLNERIVVLLGQLQSYLSSLT